MVVGSQHPRETHTDTHIDTIAPPTNPNNSPPQGNRQRRRTSAVEDAAAVDGGDDAAKGVDLEQVPGLSVEKKAADRKGRVVGPVSNLKKGGRGM